MIDTSKAKWELAEGEQYAIQWFEAHGFEGYLDKQYLSKTYFVVTKDGNTDRFALPMGSNDILYRPIMEQFGKSFELLCELEALKRKLKEK